MSAIFKRIIVSLLTLEAKLVLRRFQPKIIAVVGSVGKTSTKDAIYSVLSRFAYVRKSEKSFNSELGLPLTILGLPTGWKNPLRWIENLFDGLMLVIVGGKYPEWLILEVGADKPGDIRSVASWLPVDIVVMTRLPDVPVHIEFFDSVEQLVEEKASILKALRPDGWLILNADDEKVMALRDRTQAKAVTFGLSEGSAVRACGFSVLSEKGEKGWPVGIHATIDCRGAQLPVAVMGTIGSHSILSILASFAVGHAIGMEGAAIAEGLALHTPPPGRMRLIPGIKDSLIIDDTYNASPAATMAALEGLRLVTVASRKVAVLGDMLELGRFSVEKHREAGRLAADVADLLVCVGFRARDIAEGALDGGMKDEKILQYEDSKTAGNELQTLIASGDAVLVKGSQSTRMERVVEEIMAHPETAERMLVRQEPEWKKRG